MRLSLAAAGTSLGLLLALSLAGCVGASDGQDPVDAEGELRSATVKGSLGGRVCSWNIRRLGHNFDDAPKDHAAVAQIIKDHCDVVAVQELMQSNGGNVPGFFSLKDALGSSWDGAFTRDATPLGQSPNAERYAFYWRKSVARFCDGFEAGAEAVRYVSDRRDVFLREPAFTCLRVRDHANDLLIANYHALFGEVEDRKREVAQLDSDRGSIFREIQAAKPGADVLLVGDLNLKPNELAEALPSFADLTTGDGSTINLDDAITPNLYDHLIMLADAPLAKTVEPAEVLDVRSYAKRGATYFGTISDHLPIRFVLRKR